MFTTWVFHWITLQTVLLGTSLSSIENLRKIRKFLNSNTCNKLVQATMHYWFDYCTSLLYGTSEQNLNILLIFQNSAAWLIMNLQFYAHATEPRRQLHWLPIRQRLLFKILPFSFELLHSEVPVYLCELIQSYNPSIWNST